MEKTILKRTMSIPKQSNSLNSSEDLKIITKSTKLAENDPDLWKPLKNRENLELSSDGLGFLYDIGAIVLNQEKLGFHGFYINNVSERIERKVARLLGLIAEGLIVRDCHQNKINNKKWLTYAQKIVIENESQKIIGKFVSLLSISDFQVNPDEYIAVGTGFHHTRLCYRSSHLYDTSSKRDVLWIHKNDPNCKQLLAYYPKNTATRELFAGLQIKVSCDDRGRYFKFFLKNLLSCYPIVYFDLGGDFEKMKDEIFKYYFININKEIIKDGNKCLIHAPNYRYPRYNLKKTMEPKELFMEADPIDLEQHLVRGKDISPEIHEKLLEYKNILTKVFLKNMDLERLDSETINDLKVAFGIEYINNQISQIQNEIINRIKNGFSSRPVNIVIA